MKVNSWAEMSTKSISEKAIRDLHPVEEGYRLFPNSYEAGVKFPTKVARPIRVFVLSGTCIYLMGDQQISMSGGQYVDLLPGQFEFEVRGVAPVRLVSVFKMPDATLA